MRKHQGTFTLDLASLVPLGHPLFRSVIPLRRCPFLNHPCAAFPYAPAQVRLPIGDAPFQELVVFHYTTPALRVLWALPTFPCALPAFCRASPAFWFVRGFVWFFLCWALHCFFAGLRPLSTFDGIRLLCSFARLCPFSTCAGLHPTHVFKLGFACYVILLCYACFMPPSWTSSTIHFLLR